jgi:hypothetical protein
MRRSLAVIFVSFTFVACGSSDTSNPMAACDSAVSATCNRLQACTDLGTLTLAECNTTGQQELNCTTAACAAGSTFSSSAANQCISDINAQSCTTVEQGLPASCGTVCVSN